LRVAVVGGGLAGLSAALELVDGGHEVVLHEARPTLGGAVQTLPARAGDPEPPPDNGQHIGLGCFTEYLRFLDRIGEGGSFLRTRLALGSGDKTAYMSEADPITKMGKKVVAARTLPAGHTLADGDLALKSPADGGLPPYELDALLGRVLRHPVAEDSAITFDDLEEVLYAPEHAGAPAHGD